MVPTCKPSPCKEEGTCNSGVCIGGSDSANKTPGECGTADPFLYVPDTPVQCCNGGCCPKGQPFCCRYLITNDYTW